MDRVEQVVLHIYAHLLGKISSHDDLKHIVINEIMKMGAFNNLTTDEIEEAIYRYEVRYGSRTFEPGITITKQKSGDTWLLKKKKKLALSNHKFQKRYEQYLLQEHYSDDAKRTIMKEAEKILSLCADPDSNEKTRGLVMGDVQSGKTSNYLALANLACDYGYRIVLILAGMTDSLRIQTQERVDEGLIGAVSSTIEEKQEIKYIGVGTIGTFGYYAVPLTTDKKDFKTLSCLSNDLNKPQILVVKKNKKVLEAVKKWLKPGQANVSGRNILIIDDECDNASVNTKPSSNVQEQEDPSTINKLIRDIYNNFECAAYVGYTATPFANIFINPEKIIGFDDLFPSDFIHRLKSANEVYFGIDKVFREDRKHIKILNENEDFFIPAKHKANLDVWQLPNSLKDAICAFLIANCIRTFRGDKTKHRSMMINASAYNPVQEKLLELVERYVSTLLDAISQYDKYNTERFIKHEELKRIYEIYNSDSLFNAPISLQKQTTIKDELSFEQVKELLYEEISKFRVVVINSKRKGDQRFKYKDYKETGARVIAIGGFVLSRGLTLDGLMISYYSRNSVAYDTLLQMCRWFGYRPRYEDLCAVYMSQNNYDCFCAVVDALDNLDSQLEVMQVQGATPKDFGLMIMESPDTLETNLLITARNKLRNSVEIIKGLNYSGVDIDTSKLFQSIDHNKNNYIAVQKFVKLLSEKGLKIQKYEHDRYMIKDVSNTDLADLIELLKIPLENKKFDVENITEFIRKGEYYKKWDVVFATGEKQNVEPFKLYDENGQECLSIPPVKRSFALEEDEDIIRISKNNNRLLEPGIFNAGLTEPEIEEAKELARKRPSKKEIKKENKTPIARDYLSVKGRKPLFVILPIKLDQDEPDAKESDYSDKKKELINKFTGDEWLIGFGIGFAGREGKVMHKFRINKVKQEEYLRRIQEEILDD